jgi:hypothetical protein
MFRVLVRTPRRRLAGLVLTVALTWTAWVLWPPKPAARWSLPVDEVGVPLFTPDGRTVVTAQSGQATLPNGSTVYYAVGPLVGRDAETGRERYRLFGSVPTMALIRVTPDGRRLTLAANPAGWTTPGVGDLTDLLVIDPADGRQIAALTNVDFQIEKDPGPDPPHSEEHINPVSADGRWVAYRRRRAPDLRLYDLDAGRDGPVLEGARPPAAFTPAGRTLAARTADNHLGFWDVETGIRRPPAAGRGPEVRVNGLWFSPDGRTLAARIDRDAPSEAAASPSPPPLSPWTVALWDVATGARKPDPPVPEPRANILGLYFSRDGRFLAVPWVSPDRLVDLAADPPAVVRLTLGEPSKMNWPGLPLPTPDNLVVVYGGPHELALFDPATRERRQTFRLGHGPVGRGEDARLSPDGRTLLVSYLAQTWFDRLPLPDRVRVWLRQTGHVSDRETVAAAFEVATGRRLRSVEFPNYGRSETFLAQPHPFGADGRSFWTVTPPVHPASGLVVFERWSVDPPGPPWWPLGLTAVAVGVAVVDRARMRRKGA